MRLLSVAALWTVAAVAAPEGPPAYRYTSKPLRVPVACTYEQVQNLGLSCTESEPCRTFLELSDLEQVGARVFLTGNIHTDSATIESILLASDDDGRTWTEPTARIPTAGLDHIQFIDFETGWISGQIQQLQPKDPFFLISHDGGKTWRKQAVWTDARPGAVDRFHFESRTNGAMMIDRVQPDDNGMRFVLYETATGGESWSIREISPKPIAWKYPQTEAKELRIREHAPTMSYRLERRQGSKWDLVAAFDVAAGDCKPADPVPAGVPGTAEPQTDDATSKPNYDRPVAPRRPPTLKK